MRNNTAGRLKPILAIFAGTLVLLAAVPIISVAQDRLKTMPGYEQYQKVSKEIPNSVKLGVLAVKWLDGGKAFEYRKDGKTYRFDIATLTAAEVSSSAETPPADARPDGRRQGGPARGRQFDSAASPDGKMKAFYRERNLWLSNADGSNEAAITTDGNEKARTKYGVASWVYGEELRQTTAMWWAPDGSKIAFYRFDESQVPDYYLQLDQTRLQSKVDDEAYPKRGVHNPAADLLVYDLATKKTTTMDVRDGKPFDNAVVGHYVYHVSWSQDGAELLFNRTNRRQNIMEFTACNPSTGKTRVIVREEWVPS